MNNRRDFLKQAGIIVAASTLTGGSIFSQEKKSKEATLAENPTLLNGKENNIELVKIKVKAPLFCPYNSNLNPSSKSEDRGGNAYYYLQEAFLHNPFTCRASGMSGSPIIIDANGKFIGFMTTQGFESSTFSFDGKETLTVTVPEGQKIHVDENGNGDAAWKNYNSIMMRRLNIEPIKQFPKFWADVEYCTWVEQKFLAKGKGAHFKILSHDFIAQYIDGIIELGYPKGKLTLDHGWGLFPNGNLNAGFGSWIPDPKIFPDFRKTMDMINEKGFTPGLWIGFPKVHGDSLIGKKYPEILGTKNTSDDVRYLNPKADIFEYAAETINRFYQMGVMKFKIDMSYGTKSDMLHIHKELYLAAKSINKDIEMEFHVPDIFFAKYGDTFRTNDVWCRDEYNWTGRVDTHYEITSKSAPGRGINLDHIGGNDTGVLTETKYLKHLEMFKTKTGYPCISLLPNHISAKCTSETGDYLWNYEKGNKNIINEFYTK